MAEYELRVTDPGEYAADLEILREARMRMGRDEESRITLKWKKEGQEEKLVIFARGANLWIEAYEDAWKKKEKFESHPGRQNYQHGDDCGMIGMENMTGILSSFRNLQGEITAWRNGGLPEAGAAKECYLRRKVRVAYLVCIFLASEVVRNELLQNLYCEKDGRVTWKSCLPLFKNWALMAGIVYPELLERDETAVVREIRRADLKEAGNKMPPKVFSALAELARQVKDS